MATGVRLSRASLGRWLTSRFLSELCDQFASQIHVERRLLGSKVRVRVVAHRLGNGGLDLGPCAATPAILEGVSAFFASDLG